MLITFVSAEDSGDKEAERLSLSNYIRDGGWTQICGVRFLNDLPSLRHSTDPMQGYQLIFPTATTLYCIKENSVLMC